MKTLLAVVITLLSLTFTLGAWDVASELRMGNIGFDRDSSSPEGASGGVYDPLLHFEGSFSMKNELTDMISFEAGFDRDAILKNRVFTLATFEVGFATLTVGPYFGPFNYKNTLMTSGLSTALNVKLPGVFYGQFRSDSTIGAGLASSDDYVQEMALIEAGFWVPNVLVSARLSSKSFSLMKSAALTTVDKLTRYDLLAQVFKKNVPYTVQLDLAWQTLTRSYVGSTTEDKDRLDSILMGSTVTVTWSPTLSFYGGGEFSLYSWCTGGLLNPSTDTALFTVNVGVTWKIPENGIKERRSLPPPLEKEVSAEQERAKELVKDASGENAAKIPAEAGEEASEAAPENKTEPAVSP